MSAWGQKQTWRHEVRPANGRSLSRFHDGGTGQRGMRDGTRLETLAEAGSFILALPEALQFMAEGERASDSCRGPQRQYRGRTEAIERAGSMQFLWMPTIST